MHYHPALVNIVKTYLNSGNFPSAGYKMAYVSDNLLIILQLLKVIYLLSIGTNQICAEVWNKWSYRKISSLSMRDHGESSYLSWITSVLSAIFSSFMQGMLCNTTCTLSSLSKGNNILFDRTYSSIVIVLLQLKFT